MKKNISNIILRNTISLVLIEIVLIFMHLGYKNLDLKVFVTDLRVFAFLTLFLSLYMLEKAYRKDSGIMAITGIEVLVLAIITLVLPNAYYAFEHKLVNLDFIVMLGFCIYYLIKIVTHILLIKFRKTEKAEVDSVSARIIKICKRGQGKHMIKSMTGFGRGSFSNEGREYIIEIKAINHKYSDVNVRIPRAISYLEDKVRKYILDSISRGKVDVFITFNNYSNFYNCL